MAEARVEIQLLGIASHHPAAQAATGELLADLRTAPEVRSKERDAIGDRAKGAALELVVSLGASGAIASFVRIVQLWLSRDQRRRITVSVHQVPNGKTITIEGERISIDTLTNALGAAIKSETTATAEADGKSNLGSSNPLNWLPVLVRRNFSDLCSVHITWGGWGSNPRPADYENYGPMHRAH